MSFEENPKYYLHVDLDAFFASVEQLDHPELRGKPVIVGGKPEDRRSVVSTASYEARKFGVHSAMPTFQAYKLCPQGIFVHGRMQRYAELSHQIMNIFRDYSPDVDQMSIDEAFIDLTGTEKLFGPPEETAAAIKARVKKETGLTVSVGLASTKYLAKIASGLSKPDGFYHIKSGTEESFMLNLPLNKVWGLGPKSLELIKSKGFNSTRDIYERDYETLEFLFGKNMASFLYNVVRGIEKESFSRESKSHSISAETTFPYDLTDIYTIETELLELAHGVFFRLLKEESFSRTAFVKIRYDDFSTCTIQETVERNIITLDSYFEIIKKLFEKKYENGRGIRLLGLGFENITKEEKPYQQDLFSNSNDEKKQAVEKAILNLSKKHPEIKVRKARTFKAIITAFLLICISSNKNYAQNIENPKPLSAKEPPTLFEYEIDDKNLVDIELSGYWKAELSSAFTASFGNETESAFSAGMPVFKQDVELFTKVLLNRIWYFQADFADDFKNNTIAIGYENDTLIRSFRLSNRNISMPDGYSADYFGFGLKGGNNQAPGFYLHLMPDSQKWQADFLLRYDMTETKTATFYGMNSLQENKISPSDFLYGREFRFPESAKDILYDIEDIYVENGNGKYRRLSEVEYSIVYSRNRLYLSESAASEKNVDGKIPSILITFRNGGLEKIINQCGSYNNPSDFLGQIQSVLGNDRYNICDFAYNLKSEVDGKQALKIQSSTGFSPFLCPNNYSTGNKTDSEVCVIYTESGKTLTQYKSTFIDKSYTALYEDFFENQNNYVKIYIEDNSEAIENIYPFASICPEIYLNLKSSCDISILSKTFTTEKEFNIGKKASEGSVKVYKNGRLIPNAKYNKNTGTLSLDESISSTDIIIVNWQEDTVDFSRGALAAGAGFKLNLAKFLNADISTTVMWPLYIKQDFTDINNQKNAFAALSAGLNYENENLKLSERAAFAMEQQNSSKGLYVIQFDDAYTKTYYHEASAAETTLKDDEISGYMVPLIAHGDFSYTDIRLDAGDLLSNSDELELALKSDFYDFDYDVYLVLGIKYGKNTDSAEEFFEKISEYPNWKLNSNTELDLSHRGWQTVRVKIDDWQRSRLTGDHDARLIIKRKDSKQGAGSQGTGSQGSTLYFGPYEPVVKSMYTYSSPQTQVTARTTRSPYLSASQGQKYVSQITWKSSPENLETIPSSQKNIVAVRNFTAADFSSYKTITWTFLSDTTQPFTLELESEEEKALYLEILDSSVLENNFENKLHTLNLNLKENKVYIDNSELPQNAYILQINKNIVPSKFKLTIKINESPNPLCGTFYCGNLIYEESELYFTLQNYTSAEYSKKESLLSIKDFPLIKDICLSADSLQASGKLDEPELSVSSNGLAKATLCGIISESHIAMNKTKISNAGHSFKTDTKLIPFISAKEKYDFDYSASSLRKENLLAFTTNSIENPFKIEFSTNANKNFLSRQNTYFLIEYNHVNEKMGAGFSSKLDLTQKKQDSVNYKRLSENDYFTGWNEISKLSFSKGLFDADEREEKLTNTLKGNFLFNKTEFKPQAGYSLQGNTIQEEINQFTDRTEMNLLLPFSWTNNAVAFEISRNGGASQTFNSAIQGDYIDDSQRVLSLQNQRLWFYEQLPFAELFDDSLSDKIKGNYSAKYEIKFKRRISNSYKDLFIPSMADFAVIRDVKTNNGDIKILDQYQYKIDISNTSLNNFGKNSLHKTFSWFMQEEIFSNLKTLIKVPRNLITADDIRFEVDFYTQILLLIKDDTYFTTAIDFVIENGPNWQSQNHFIYERPSKTSLISSLLVYFFPSIKAIPMEISRKDSLDFEFQKKTEEFSQSYTYQHSAGIKFNSHYTIDTGAGITYLKKTDSADNLSINLTLGFKAEF